MSLTWEKSLVVETLQVKTYWRHNKILLHRDDLVVSATVSSPKNAGFNFPNHQHSLDLILPLTIIHGQRIWKEKWNGAKMSDSSATKCSAVLEVDQPNRYTCLLEAVWATGSTYLLAYISLLHRTFCLLVLICHPKANKLLDILPSPSHWLPATYKTVLCHSSWGPPVPKLEDC